jgi:uncharacterized protein (DUF1501 family)
MSSKMTRRELMRLLGLGGAAAPFATGLSPLLHLNDSAQAAAASPHRFLQIFCNGGWDSALTTDPAIGTKQNTSNYDRTYWDASYGGYLGTPSVAVNGKANLKMGYGLGWDTANVNPFENVNTCFINGMYVEVTAHELAVNYLYSGKLSLSRSKEFPSYIATMADKIGGFPAHVLLGGPIPLSTTKNTNPPLQASNMDMMLKMLGGPKTFDWSNEPGITPTSISSAHTLLDALNQKYFDKRLQNESASLTSWRNAEQGIAEFYAANYQDKMDVSTLTDYNIPNSYSTEAKFAGAFRTIESNMSRFITINLGNFDTHQNHVATHIPEMQTFATALHQLIQDLRTTDDTHPAATGGQKLIDNTTILITSEFNRTPLFNSSAGTDHWTTANAILMGRGVKDNTVFGTTDAQGFAKDQTNTNTISSSSDANVFLPDHLAAAVLREFGFTDEADDLTTEDIRASIFG